MDEIKGIWIPQEIINLINLKHITWTEAVLLSEVWVLSNNRTCTASNEYFSKILGITADSVSRLVNKLVKMNYLTSKIGYLENNIKVKRRFLKLNWERIVGTDVERSPHVATSIVSTDVEPHPTQMSDREYSIEYSRDNTLAQNFSESENKPKNKPSKNLSELFEEFYKNYPKKKGKHRAYRWFKSHKPDEALVAKMIEATNNQKQTFQWKQKNGRFIPHPATWLNGGSWENEIKPEEIAHTSDKSIARFLAIELYEKLKHKTFENFGQDKKLVDLWAFDIDNYLSLNRTKEQEDRIFYAINSLESSWVKEKIHDARSLISNLDFIGR